MTQLAQHSAKSVKWGTPIEIIELARQLLGCIHLDPASSEEFNVLVKALMIYTENNSGLDQANAWYGNVFCNPPGRLVTKFWNKLTQEYTSGQVSKGFFVGFSIEQLCTMAGEKYHPTDFSICYLRKRLDFNHEDLTPGDNPSHANYVVALGCDKVLFDKLFSPLGKVCHGFLA